MFKVLYAAIIAVLVLLCFQGMSTGNDAVDPAGAENAVLVDQAVPQTDIQANSGAPVVIEAAPVETKVADIPTPNTNTVTVSTAVIAAAPVDSVAAVGEGEVDSVLGAGQTLIDAYKTGGWLALLAALVTILTALLRKPWMGGLLEKIPKRARILVPLILGCIAALLAAAAGGISWGEAAVLAFLIGPSAVTLHQGIARSLFGIDSPATKAAKSTAAGYFK